MAVTDDEIESLRFHLGFGNLSEDGPYTADGFRAVFYQVVQPNLTAGAETTASTAASVGLSTVTVVSLTGIVARARLVVDVGDAEEIVVVRSVGVLSFSAVFAAAHAANFPVAVMGGEARLRMLLGRADSAWQSMQAADIGDDAGLKRIEGDLEWFQGDERLRIRRSLYEATVAELAWLCNVEPRRGKKRGCQLEAY
ncbi:MAG TPA: hypothetical protein VFW03_26555 [Gemmatimonadaceae bacterium]|nr:hypothetical protein [Gemmatimonadaceae bacterium]